MKDTHVVSVDMLRDLCRTSRSTPRARQHLNLHQSYDEAVQRLLNVIQPGSYIRPHRHMLEPRLESLFVLQGRLALITFNDSGSVQDVVLMSAGKSDLPGVAIGVELDPGVWHTVLALEEDSVLLEIKAGPFDPAAAKEPAPWAPSEGASESAAYLDTLHQQAIRRIEELNRSEL